MNKPKGRAGKLSPSVVQSIRRNAMTRKEAMRMRKALLVILRDTPTITADAKRYGIGVAQAKVVARGLAYKRVPMPGPSRRLVECW